MNLWVGLCQVPNQLRAGPINIGTKLSHLRVSWDPVGVPAFQRCLVKEEGCDRHHRCDQSQKQKEEKRMGWWGALRRKRLAVGRQARTAM